MKTVSRNDLVQFLDQLLELDRWPDDPSNNGLQFAGDAEVAKAVFAVDASAELFCKAADLDAGFIFVHHGISWGSGIRRIDGILADRIKLLAANGMSLYLDFYTIILTFPASHITIIQMAMIFRF